MSNKEYENKVNFYKKIIQNKLDLGEIRISAKGTYKYSQTIASYFENGEEIRVYGEGKTVEKCAQSFVRNLQNKTTRLKESERLATFTNVAWEWYENEVEHSDTVEKNKADYRRDIKKELEPYFGNKNMRILKEKDYSGFMNQYSNCGECKVKHLRLTLSRIINYAYRNDYITKNHYRISLPKFVPMNKKETLPSFIIQWIIKLTKQGDSMAEDFLLLLIMGIRPIEASHLTYENINFEEKSCKIIISKTENGVRTIPLPDFAIKIIKKRIETANQKQFSTNYLFRKTNNPEKAKTVQGFEESFQAVLRKIDILNGAKVYRNQIIESTIGGEKRNDAHRTGLKYPYVPYQFRHTYSQILDEFDIGENIRKELLGHSQRDNVTEAFYTHRGMKRKHRVLKPVFDAFEKMLADETKTLEEVIEEYYE